MRASPARWSSSAPPMTITIFRGDCLDRWVRFEGRDATDAAQFREAYKDIMNPPDPSWRRMVLDEGPTIMDKLIAGVAGW